MIPPCNSPSDAWRAHKSRNQSDRGLWHFATTEDGRFNLAGPQGTCYLANDPETALRERLGHLAVDNSVPESAINGVVVSQVSIAPPRTMADMCHKDAIKVAGITREISTGSDYVTTRAWAQHFHSEGFDGVAYEPRHTTDRDSRSYAIFGHPGPPWKIPYRSTPAEDIAKAAGIHLDAPPMSRDVEIITPPGS